MKLTSTTVYVVSTILLMIGFYLALKAQSVWWLFGLQIPGMTGLIIGDALARREEVRG